MPLAIHSCFDHLALNPTGLSLLLLLLPLFLLYLSTKRSINTKKSRFPPSPPRLPFIGNLHQLGLLQHRSLHDLSKKLGPLMLLHLGQVPAVVASSPEMAQLIMKTHDLTFASRPSLKAIRILHRKSLDMGFAPYGEHWRQMRKFCVTHLFSTKIVQSFRLVREEEVAAMISKISQESLLTGAVNMREVLNSFSNDIICRILSGKFIGQRVLRELVERNQDLIVGFNLGECFPRLAWLFMLLGLDEKAKRTSERWNEIFDQMLKEHSDRQKGDGHGNNDFVNVLLSHQNDLNNDIPFTMQNMKALLMNLFSAGTVTSYLVLEWGLSELVRNSEAMKKLQREVRGIASGKIMVTEEDLSDMSYLRAVVKEVLRLHPPSPLLIPRESMENCHIEGYEIPKGTRVIVNAWAIGRDPNFWEAPNEFRPERFIGSPIDFRGKDFQFIPFGAGRRICPGMNLAISTIELALANLIHRFDWNLPHNIKGEDLDMAENPGLTSSRKERLYLVPKLC